MEKKSKGIRLKTSIKTVCVCVCVLHAIELTLYTATVWQTLLQYRHKDRDLEQKKSHIPRLFMIQTLVYIE